MKRLYSITPGKAAALRAGLIALGVRRARVRVMPNGAGRLVLASVGDRGAARDALVLVNASTPSGEPFTSPQSASAWNGPVELFFRYLRP